MRCWFTELTQTPSRLYPVAFACVTTEFQGGRLAKKKGNAQSE